MSSNKALLQDNFSTASRLQNCRKNLREHDQNNPLIANTLEAICKERDDKEYYESFDLVRKVAETFGELNLAEQLYSEIPRNIQFELVAELFNLLAWQTEDN